jgi:uncharacterized damage-inducible protein DinB
MLSQAMLAELQHESAQTKKMLSRVPLEQFSWKPHDKSMNLANLASHVAETVYWITVILSTDDFDFSRDKYHHTDATSPEHLMEIFEKDYQSAIESLKNASPEELMKPWSMSNGGKVLMTMPKAAAIRTIALNHIVHHRGQLSVYLRLLGIPVPGMYGPSADERTM